MERKALILECKNRYSAGATIESLIGFLRSVGCSKIVSIATISEACGVGLAKAKEIVHFSPLWVDTRENDEELHKKIEEYLSENL